MKIPFFSRKESATGKILFHSPGQPAWAPRNYASFAKEAYSINVVACRAINMVAEAAASVKWSIFKGDDELEQHPLMDLITRPNPMQSGPQYMRSKVGFFLISGNGYEERVTVGKVAKELHQLRPDRMKIIPASNGYPLAYEYQVGGRKVRWDVNPRDLSCDIRHMKTFNPLDDWYGMSPVEAAAYSIDQNNETMTWIQSLLQNSARPSGALVYDSDTPMSNDMFSRLKNQIEELYSGGKNAGRPMLFEGGLDWKQMGLSPVDMAILETKFASARDIALAFGVPPQMLGIPGDNTYSNYQEARLAFWEDTVIPLVNVIAADWNAWLAEPMGVELRPNYDEVPAIVTKRMKLWEMADKSDDLTINERRAIKGYDEIEGGETLLISSNQIPLDDALTGPVEVQMPRRDPNGEDQQGAEEAAPTGGSTDKTVPRSTRR